MYILIVLGILVFLCLLLCVCSYIRNLNGSETSYGIDSFNKTQRSLNTPPNSRTYVSSSSDLYNFRRVPRSDQQYHYEIQNERSSVNRKAPVQKKVQPKRKVEPTSNSSIKSNKKVDRSQSLRRKSSPKVSKKYFSNASTLRVKRLRNEKVPVILRKKHISTGPLNESKAEEISEKRAKFTENLFKSTVFEDPKSLAVCKVVDQHLENYQDNTIYVSPRKLKAFQCKKLKAGGWQSNAIGKKHAVFACREKGYHFISESLKFNDIVFVNEIEE